jgi:hypothetical protein
MEADMYDSLVGREKYRLFNATRDMPSKDAQEHCQKEITALELPEKYQKQMEADIKDYLGRKQAQEQVKRVLQKKSLG